MQGKYHVISIYARIVATKLLQNYDITKIFGPKFVLMRYLYQFKAASTDPSPCSRLRRPALRPPPRPAASPSGGRLEGAARLEGALDIHRALSLLRAEERTCITLQLIDGYAIDEIADITGLPANTVKSHLRRGKERLATFLKKNGYDGK